MTDRPFDDKPQITNFEQAIELLEDGLSRYRSNEADTMVRDGLVQRFEIVYELAHKTLKRYLMYASPNATQFGSMKFQDLIRTGNEQELLLGNLDDWLKYKDMRNDTSHTYDESTAISVVNGIPRFLEEVRYLRDMLRKNISD